MTDSTSGRLGVLYTNTPTTAEFKLGQTDVGEDGTCWVYVQASGALTQYDYVTIDENYQAAAGTAAALADGHAVGFAQSAFADDDYGWVAIKGSNIKARLAAACAADVPLYTSATAGVLDDASSGQTKVDGVVAVTGGVTAASSAEIIATWPKSTTF